MKQKWKKAFKNLVLPVVEILQCESLPLPMKSALPRSWISRLAPPWFWMKPPRIVQPRPRPIPTASIPTSSLGSLDWPLQIWNLVETPWWLRPQLMCKERFHGLNKTVSCNRRFRSSGMIILWPTMQLSSAGRAGITSLPAPPFLGGGGVAQFFRYSNNNNLY